MNKWSKGIKTIAGVVSGVWLLGFPAMAGAAVVTCKPGDHYIGPPDTCHNWPWVDINANGQYDPGVDVPVSISSVVGVGPPLWQINNPYDQSNGGNLIYQDSTDSQGQTTGFHRQHTDYSHYQSAVVTTLDPGGFPTVFTLSDLDHSGNPRSTTLTLNNNPAGYDSITLAGGGLNLSTPLVKYVDGNGRAFVSVPWGFMSHFKHHHAAASGLHNLLPQVWIPVSGNGQIVMDLNGDGTPDPEFYQSPVLPLAALPAASAPFAILVPWGNPAAIPTLSELALILSALALLTISWRALRRHGGDGLIPS